MGAGGPTSRRSTRSAGVRESCSSGGKAKPPSTATAVRKPIPSGASPGAGRSPRSQPDSTLTSHACAPNPISDPITAAISPINTSCERLTMSVKLRVAPRVFISATESRCSCT